MQDDDYINDYDYDRDMDHWQRQLDSAGVDYDIS